MDRIIKARYIALFLLTAIMLSACTVISANSGETNDVTIAQTDLETMHSTEAATSETSIAETTIAETTIEETESTIDSYRNIYYIEDEVRNRIPEEIMQALLDKAALWHYGEAVNCLSELPYAPKLLSASEIQSLDSDEYGLLSGEFCVVDLDQDGVSEVVLHEVHVSYIFRVFDNGVHVYDSNFRSLNPILSNGITVGSGGASIAGLHRYSFSENDMSSTTLATLIWEAGASEPLYYAGNPDKDPTLEAYGYDKFREDFPCYFDEGYGVGRYTFCKENIY